jgi:ribosomal protein S12 methylthiotransferase accessory factor
LTHLSARYVPTAYCYYGFRDPGVFFTRCDSNGNASGNTLEEAILYGFLELVERDSVALWWYNRVQRPQVDPGGMGLYYWDEMKRYYARELGRELHALDLTSDLGIPTFAVVSRRPQRAVEDIIVGFAAHLDPSVALLRALEEANQYLPSVREEAEDGSTIYRLYSQETLAWWKSATFENQPFLVPARGFPRYLKDVPSLSSDNVRTDVETCLAVASRAGLEVLVLDQTRPDIALPVVKVMVPGLRHFWRRLAPGRLYDVPVKLGWLPSPLREEEMNPISCFV